jgi:hypothetical protein
MDALDRPRPRQKWSKKQKQAYAKEKAMEELLSPPKNPPPAWLENPDLLPKKPPQAGVSCRPVMVDPSKPPPKIQPAPFRSGPLPIKRFEDDDDDQLEDL